ncbi:acyl dehydratase [Halobacteriales archaeon QS_8_69_26]|nr:MAG: acyl dehydratase [Halobacteriales archaeon QS_8_69_26]
MLVPIAVREVMSADVETVGPGATVADAARSLRETTVGSLVVVDDGEPVGIVAETDLVELMADGGDPESRTVESVMSAPLVTVGPDAELDEAADLLAREDVKKLPVVEDGDLAGIATTTDLSRYLPVYADRQGEDRERVRRDVLPDTSYEREDWTFEYQETTGGSDSVVEVGDVARFSKPLSEEDVRAFADASGDTNRLHLDDRFAEGTRFDRRIAHGSLTAGVISAALARLPGLTIYLSTEEMHFLGPVDVGDRVTAVCEVVEDLGGGRYRLSTSVEDGEGEEVVSGSAVVLVDRLPADDGQGAGRSDDPGSRSGT